jgi:hypothetical protein
MHSYSGFLRNTGSPICGVIKAAPVNILFWVPLFRGHPMMDGSIISQGADYFKMFITSTCLIILSISFIKSRLDISLPSTTGEGFK